MRGRIITLLPLCAILVLVALARSAAASLRQNTKQYLENWGSYYWWNEVTNEVNWSPQVVFWEEHVDDHGRVFYYNALTGDSSWEIPVEAAWEARHSKEHGEHYYWNKVTGKTQWQKPAELAWKRVPVQDESDEL